MLIVPLLIKWTRDFSLTRLFSFKFIIYVVPIQRKTLFDLLNLFYEHSIHIDNDVLNKYNSIIDKWICLSLPHIILIFPSHLSNDVLTDLLSDKTYFINENEKKKWVKVLILTRSRRTIQLIFFDRIYIVSIYLSGLLTQW